MWWTDAAARLRVTGPALLAATALCACATAGGGTTDPTQPLTPTQQFSAKVEETPDRLALAPHAEGLSPAQRIALVGFVARWRQAAGAGDIAVQTPAAGGDPAAVSRTASEVLGALQALGVPSQRVRTGDYEASPGSELVLASYSSLEARGPDCRLHWDGMTFTGDNRPMEHFGCATTANFAAMIADPRDLLAPAATTPSDASRRETVLSKYRAGEVSSTARDNQAAGAISSAVGGQ
jgi:pilus assembly protein CpaD